MMRLDYRFIEQHVPRGARVLDLGCGDGSLLKELIEKRDVDGIGIEIDETAVQDCISAGVPVYHGDMLEGISMFEEGSFDVVILSRTLQQSLEPARLVSEIIRVGQLGIISFPNFGYWPLRLKFLFSGRMPRDKKFKYSWHDSPNIHLLTVKDFVDYCRGNELQIVDRIFFTPSYYRLPTLAANLFAALAVFVIKK
ncbi:MAG: methionine biosynthesis protein MetW [bacterium]